MKIAKYTMYVEIRDYEDITTKELESQIKDRVLSQGALNGTCFLKEEASRIIETEDWDCKQWDNRPLNFIPNIHNPEVWEKELKGGEITMDNDQITALAREYAEEIRPYNDKTAPLSILDIREAERLIRFLLRRFCIVEKKDVETMYQEAKGRYFNPDDEIEKAMYGGRMSLLEYLFPEIAKEVDNGMV